MRWRPSPGLTRTWVSAWGAILQVCLSHQLPPHGEPTGERHPPREVRDRIGRYQILERVGRGGMVTVYRAYDPEITDTVALKILHAHDDDSCRK